QAPATRSARGRSPGRCYHPRGSRFARSAQGACPWEHRPGSSADGSEDLVKKAKAARVEAVKKAPKPRRPGGKVVQMDLFRAGAERDKRAPKNASKERPARKRSAEPPVEVADASEIADHAAAGVSVPAPAAPKTGAAAKSGAAGTSRKRETAETIGRRQREISVAEFFQKNRHLLGFDNPAKALLTATKEAVDNSLDACEEAGILPEISVVIEEQAE